MTAPAATGQVHGARRPLRVGIVLVGVLGVAAYLLASSWATLFPQPRFTAMPAAGCDLNTEACLARFDNGRSIRLALEPRPLTASRPLRLQVATAGIVPSSARAEFSGVGMNMGRLEIPLQTNGDGELFAKTTLPACIRRQMTWRVLITLDDPQGLHRATFVFDVNR